MGERKRERWGNIFYMDPDREGLVRHSCIFKFCFAFAFSFCYHLHAIRGDVVQEGCLSFTQCTLSRYGRGCSGIEKEGLVPCSENVQVPSSHWLLFTMSSRSALENCHVALHRWTGRA